MSYHPMLRILAWGVGIVSSTLLADACPPSYLGIEIIEGSSIPKIVATARVSALSTDADGISLTEVEARMEAKAQLQLMMQHRGIPFEGGGITSRVICINSTDIYATAIYDPLAREQARRLRSSILDSMSD